MELACSLRSALGHPLHYLYFEFQYCVNLKTQSETGRSHADVSAPLRAMNLLLLVQTEVPPIPARGSLQEPFPVSAKRRPWPGMVL